MARSVTAIPSSAPVASVLSAAADVEFEREELTALRPQYDLIRDCVRGETAVKAALTTYLPMPVPTDRGPQNLARYDNYVKRAVFYNVTKRTLAGLVGQVFLADPIIEVPKLIEPILKDANGSGISLIQLAEETERKVISFGRAGLLADFPRTEDGGSTRRQQLDGDAQGTISLYDPTEVINWRVMSRGRKKYLSLVVLRENYVKSDDGFKYETEVQYRVLRMVNKIYQQEIWRRNSGWGIFETITPRDGAGNTLTEIPFTFVGSQNNDAEPDDPPLYDLASINLAHYRNSADYEENLFICGQATPVFTGLTEHWVKEVFKGEIHFGARNSIPLPEGATAQMLTMPENGILREAMDAKERQMVALGAKLVEQKQVQRTATEANQEEASEASMLTTITNNVSQAFKWCLEWCAIFAGATTVDRDARETSTKFELSTEFDLSAATPDQINGVIDAWVKEAITYSEMREQLIKMKAATLPLEKAKAERKSDAEEFGTDDDDLNPDDVTGQTGDDDNADE